MYVNECLDGDILFIHLFNKLFMHKCKYVYCIVIYLFKKNKKKKKKQLVQLGYLGS